jgi:hypothetical protein
MYFSKISAFALTSLSVAWASPTLNARQNGVTCQTSDGSPETGDVTFVINEIRDRGDNCRQTNGAASRKIPSALDILHTTDLAQSVLRW